MKLLNIDVDPRAFGAGAALTTFIVTQTMLTAATKTAQGLPYKTTSAVLLQEAIKLAFATGYWLQFDYKKRYDGLGNFNTKSFLMYMIPGLIYACQNSIVYTAIAILGPPTFQVFSNFKIVTTAILHRIILPNRGLTIIQWLAVALLFISMVISKLGVFTSEQSSGWASQQDLIFGGGLLIVNSTMSAFSGVFNEWLIKKIDPEAPLQFKNMQLYFFGVMLNLIGNMLQSAPGTNTEEGFFAGFTPVVWLIIFNNAALGISVAYIMKYANNVIKCFTSAVAVYIATYLSTKFFNETIDLAFVCGVVVLTAALYLYMGNHNKVLKAHDEANKPNKEEGGIDLERLDQEKPANGN